MHFPSLAGYRVGSFFMDLLRLQNTNHYMSLNLHRQCGQGGAAEQINIPLWWWGPWKQYLLCGAAVSVFSTPAHWMSNMRTFTNQNTLWLSGLQGSLCSWHTWQESKAAKVAILLFRMLAFQTVCLVTDRRQHGHMAEPLQGRCGSRDGYFCSAEDWQLFFCWILRCF